MQHNLALRHRVTMDVRKYFDEQGFLEIETPMLAKSTPEGARDYLVPSRVHPGEFYALPQSPQIFKQILMISGFDRYFQIVKCFRDEDLRADRQPEFTQIDLEMSFATEDLVFSTIEPLMERLMGLIGREAPRPFLRMPYAEAIAKYGSDKPDLRCGMEISDVSAAFSESAFAVFRDGHRIGRRGPRIRRCRAPRRYSRRELDEVVEQAKQLGAGGLVWARAAEGAVQSSALKVAGEDAIRRALEIAEGGTRRPAPHGRRQARADVEAPRDASASARAPRESARPGEVRVSLGRRLSDVRVGRGGAAPRVHAPPVHVAARERCRDSSRPIRAGLAPAPTTSC